MSVATKTALGLTLGLLACAASARADNGYQPYYTVDRDAMQFANVPPPMQAGIAPAPVQEPGHSVPWQPAQVTVAKPAVVQETSDWHSQPDIYHYNNEVWGSVGTSLLNYEESVKPLPDSEHGWLGSIATGGSYMTTSNLYFAADGSISFGNAHYNGALFASPSTPAQATTHQTISTLDAKVGQGFYISRDAMLMPYIDGGFRYWKRDLGGGSVEDYQNFDALGGLMLEITPVDQLLLSAYGSAGTTIAARMMTGGASYDLGDSMMFKAGGKVGFELTRQIELFSTLDYDHFRFGKSPVVNSTMEPGSFTNDTTWRVGIGYHFK